MCVFFFTFLYKPIKRYSIVLNSEANERGAVSPATLILLRIMYGKFQGCVSGSAFNIRIRIRVGKIENTGNRKMEKLYFYFETNSLTLQATLESDDGKNSSNTI